MLLPPNRHTPESALTFFREVVSSTVRSEAPDLSSRQLAVLLIAYQSAEPKTVRALAQELAISKPAVTRALDTLGRHGFVRRRRDAFDRRSVLVEVTAPGSAYARDLADLILERAGVPRRGLAVSAA